MKNVMKVFLSLAVFAQFLVIISAKQNRMNSRSKLRNVSENKGKSTMSRDLNPIHSMAEKNAISEDDISERKCIGAECICEAYLDLALIVESPVISGKDDWIERYGKFVPALVKRFDVSGEKVHMALALFTTKIQILISFADEESRNKEQFLSMFNSIPLGGTRSGGYIPEAAYETLAQIIQGKGGRGDAAKVSVMISDGVDDVAMRFIPIVAEIYRQQGVRLLTVGMGYKRSENLFALARCSMDEKDCSDSIEVRYQYFSESVTETKNKICNMYSTSSKSIFSKNI